MCFLSVVYTKKTHVWKTEYIMIQKSSLHPDEDEDGFLHRKKNWIFFFLIMKENLIMI